MTAPKGKRPPVREMEYAPDAGAEHLGMTPVEIEPERTDVERLALEIINSADMHSHGADVRWWRLPHAGTVGRVKAEATRRKWERGRNIDGRHVRFKAIAVPEKDGPGWGVAIAYDPDAQAQSKPEPQPRDADTTEPDAGTEPTQQPQPDHGGTASDGGAYDGRQPSFDEGSRFMYN